jgi:hypothetical protein
MPARRVSPTLVLGGRQRKPLKLWSTSIDLPAFRQAHKWHPYHTCNSRGRTILLHVVSSGEVVALIQTWFRACGLS